MLAIVFDNISKYNSLFIQMLLSTAFWHIDCLQGGEGSSDNWHLLVYVLWVGIVDTFRYIFLWVGIEVRCHNRSEAGWPRLGMMMVEVTSPFKVRLFRWTWMIYCKSFLPNHLLNRIALRRFRNVCVVFLFRNSRVDKFFQKKKNCQNVLLAKKGQ